MSFYDDFCDDSRWKRALARDWSCVVYYRDSGPYSYDDLGVSWGPHHDEEFDGMRSLENRRQVLVGYTSGEWKSVRVMSRREFDRDFLRREDVEGAS